MEKSTKKEEDKKGEKEEEEEEDKEEADKGPTAEEMEADYMEPRLVAKYELIQIVGKGAYGVVWKAINNRNREVVAIKKIYDAFANPIDAKRSYREVYFLNEIEHPNIMRVIRTRKSKNNRDIYIIAEFIENDLHAVIRANICEEIQMRFIIWQILKALEHIHNIGIIHRDVKPSNVLINRDCLVKLADFSLSRYIGLEENNTQTMLSDYVAARWYRAPEILLGSSRYNNKVDMWGVGCIIAEMYLNRPLFPGSSTLNQISRIIEVTGKPTSDELNEIHSPVARTIFDNLKLDRKIVKPLRELVPRATPEALQIMEDLLKFSPSKRIDATDALEYSYVKQFNSIAGEQKAFHEIEVPLDDNKTYKIEEYQKFLFSYIKKRNKYNRDNEINPIYYAKFKNYQQ